MNHALSTRRYVYLIECPRFAKIGISVDPMTRIKSIAGERGISKTELKIRYAYLSNDAMNHEKQLHLLLDKYRRFGEWFDKNPIVYKTYNSYLKDNGCEFIYNSDERKSVSIPKIHNESCNINTGFDYELMKSELEKRIMELGKVINRYARRNDELFEECEKLKKQLESKDRSLSKMRFVLMEAALGDEQLKQKALKQYINNEAWNWAEQYHIDRVNGAPMPKCVDKSMLNEVSVLNLPYASV